MSARRAAMSGGIAFLQRTRNAIQGGFMYRPAWFDAAVQYQPAEPPKATRENVKPIEYPEDRLLAVLAKRHPELWANTVINLVPDDLGRIGYTHPASAFVGRWKHWISVGLPEEEAYQAVLEDWKRQRRFERIELQTAMAQAAEQGVELQVETPWQQRYQEEFKEALTRRLNLEQQKRRERLEALLEARDAEGERGLIDMSTLDPDVSQADLRQLLDHDERAQQHFGGDSSTFSVEIERLLPRKGDPEFEAFREFIDARLSEEERSLLDSDQLPDPTQGQYFKQLDEAMSHQRRLQLEEAHRAQQALEGPISAAKEAADGASTASSVSKGKKKKVPNTRGGKKGGKVSKKN